jgi:AraC-like DNA-binding protein
MVEIFDNIKKIYRFSPACEDLSQYIEFFSESCIEDTAGLAGGRNFQVKMFPSWTPTIWINLGKTYHIELQDKWYRINKDEDILVLRDMTTVRHNQAADYIFTVKFFPGGLEAIFAISQIKLLGRIIPLQEIMDGHLIETVRMAPSFGSRMELLQNDFLTKLNRQRRKDHYLNIVRDSIMAAEDTMQINVGQMAEKMFVTSKTINRYFKQVVGVSPKKYFSSLRSRAALTNFIGDRSNFIPENFGYYDMSHFYKEIIKFTGQRMNTSC